jgi:very-short-patch-repair endonuclease
MDGTPLPNPLPTSWGEGICKSRGGGFKMRPFWRGAEISACRPVPSLYAFRVNPTERARQLRREQTEEERQLWQVLRAGRFAGFKFRRQHPAEKFFLDVYCPAARLAVELDGFHHGRPDRLSFDAAREAFLAAQDIQVLRFWNHQWRKNREGVLVEIWEALHRRTGCVKVRRKELNHRFAPPESEQLIEKPGRPGGCRPAP